MGPGAAALLSLRYLPEGAVVRAPPVRLFLGAPTVLRGHRRLPPEISAGSRRHIESLHPLEGPSVRAGIDPGAWPGSEMARRELFPSSPPSEADGEDRKSVV